MSLKAPVSLLLSGLLFGLAHAPAAWAQADQALPLVGGDGGGPFAARCAQGDILNGFELRTGDDVDSIRPICVTPRSAASIGGRYAFTRKFGGDGGGNTVQLVCPDTTPAITAVRLYAEGVKTIVLNDVEVYCSVAVPNEPLGPMPTVRFNGEAAGTSSSFARYDEGMQSCPRGLLPVGITGRSGSWLDAVGLICGASPLSGSAVKSLGRVDTGSSGPPRPARSICEAAADARARNSPAAPNLEKQCAANKPQPVGSIGRVDTGTNQPRADRSICDAAVDARARNSPAAASLEAQCQAAGGIYKMRPSDADFELVRARGEALAGKDPSAAAIRATLYDAPRRGFDIGLGIWGDDTAPGPGKQRFHDFLAFAEQQGFDMAAAYALPRNKYAGQIAVANAINAADARVRTERNAGKDGYYWLGFDIASGIFGDPRAGAQGNTALGTGSIAIRDSLNTAGRNGFNASVKLHLSRNYR
jgi:hypothetical protein